MSKKNRQQSGEQEFYENAPQAPQGPRVSGTILKVLPDKGFGFITDGKVEYFFHRSTVRGTAFEQLQINQQVIFTIVASQKGPRAEAVELA